MKNYVVIYFVKHYCNDLDSYDSAIEFKNICADSIEEAYSYFVEDMEHIRSFYRSRDFNTKFNYEVLLVNLSSFVYSSLLTDYRNPDEVLEEVNKYNKSWLYELLQSELCST